MIHYSAAAVKGVLTLLFLTVYLGGCARPDPALYPPDPDRSDNKTVYVVNHGWHTGIVLRTQDALPHISLQDDMTASPYIEIGWGDETYYQAEDPTFGMGLKALFWPTDTVLHVVALSGEPASYFPGSEVKALLLSHRGFLNLVGYIDRSFTLDNAQPVALGKGLYGNSRFYRANGTFHLFNNCNTWTAKAIRTSGFPISTFYAYTADNVLYQLRQAEP